MKIRLQRLLWPLLGLAVGLLLLGDQPRIHALPEYATRTGEPCSTCHVNPAGGGPRTARGALWLAQGRPDQVPQLPESAQPAATEPADATAGASSVSADSAGGKAQYEKLGCVACHGANGEGAAGPALAVPAAVAEAGEVIRNGRAAMPGYKAELLSDAELADVVLYLQSLAGIQIKAPSAATARPTRAAGAVCASGATADSALRSCGGN